MNTIFMHNVDFKSDLIVYLKTLYIFEMLPHLSQAHKQISYEYHIYVQCTM